MDLSAYLDLFVVEAREHLGAASTLAVGRELRGASEAVAVPVPPLGRVSVTRKPYDREGFSLS